MGTLKELVTRRGKFIGQLYIDHVGSSNGVTIYRGSRGYACGIARDGESFVIVGSRMRYFPHALADGKEYLLG